MRTGSAAVWPPLLWSFIHPVERKRRVLLVHGGGESISNLGSDCSALWAADANVNTWRNQTQSLFLHCTWWSLQALDWCKHQSSDQQCPPLLKRPFIRNSLFVLCVLSNYWFDSNSLYSQIGPLYQHFSELCQHSHSTNEFVFKINATMAPYIRRNYCYQMYVVW